MEEYTQGDPKSPKSRSHFSELSGESTHEVDGTSLNLQSPRGWLEYCEATEGQEGAYTVMRCDFCPSSKQWRLWGVDFHKDRLMASIEKLPMTGQRSAEDFSTMVAGAMERVDGGMSRIFEAVERANFSDGDGTTSAGHITLMLTILLVPLKSKIKVRAHGFHAGKLTKSIEYAPNGIVAGIVCGVGLPNRYQNVPEAKLSSWCRRRRPLESRFKAGNIGELLLTKSHADDDIELLEGLTSNLFVLYKDGTLRTPPCDSVLGGYARQLVIDHAEECHIECKEGPIKLSESSQWREVFITSSIRLITPVKKVVISEHGVSEGCERIIWVQPSLGKKLSWHTLYHKIVHSHNSMDS